MELPTIQVMRHCTSFLLNYIVQAGESDVSFIRVFAKIKDDVKILVLKNAGEFAEAFDIIMAIWANMLSYHSYMHGLLEDLFKYLDGTVGGPAHPVFNTLLLFILEREEVVLSSQHKLLPLEVSKTHCFCFKTNCLRRY